MVCVSLLLLYADRIDAARGGLSVVGLSLACHHREAWVQLLIAKKTRRKL